MQHHLQPFNVIPAIFSTITSINLEEIVLAMGIESESDLDSPVWARMAEILERPRFSRLRKLEFRIIGEAAEIARRRLIQLLSRWNNIGVLRI